MQRTPAYRIIPLNVASHACETSQNAKTPSAYRLSSLKAVPLIKVCLYLGIEP
jgi:hypothetical protein